MTRMDDGHFTTMQVRRRAVQGLGLHLKRLGDATRELFDAGLDESRVRAAMIAALDAQRLDEATMRITVGSTNTLDASPVGDCDAPRILVTLSAPLVHAPQPLRLGSVEYQRTLPHIKHTGTFASHHYRRLARRDGFDDVLFVAAEGRVLEGSFWNIGFWRGPVVVWPEAAALRGVGEQQLQAGLSAAGMAQSTEFVTLAALAGLDGGFIVNSRGVRAVEAVNGCAWPADTADLAVRLQAMIAEVEWEPLQA